MEITPEAVLEFWFPPQPCTAAELNAASKLWFAPTQAQNRVIAAQFSGAVVAAKHGELDHWEAAAPDRLALILILDQFTRCIYRGSAEAFSGDGLALDLALEGISDAQHMPLAPIQRQFFFMPLQHSEDLGVQEQSVVLFSELANLANDAEKNNLRDALRYARLHRDIIAEFGRFPHRNKVLGRDNTAAENEYLANNGPTFGQ